LCTDRFGESLRMIWTIRNVASAFARPNVAFAPFPAVSLRNDEFAAGHSSLIPSTTADKIITRQLFPAAVGLQSTTWKRSRRHANRRPGRTGHRSLAGGEVSGAQTICRRFAGQVSSRLKWRLGNSAVSRSRRDPMPAANLVQMIDATLTYFGSLGNWYKDPAGVEAVREVRDRMVRDLESFHEGPSKPELAELCRQWRALRIEASGEPTYPTDMFIESVCQVIEIS
jgi:hypothetical protein